MSQLRARARSLKLRLALLAAAGIFCAVAFGFALAALYIFLAGQWGALNACLALAGGLMVVALGLVIGARAVATVEARQRRRQAVGQAALAATENLAPKATLAALAAVALAGYAAGRR